MDNFSTAMVFVFRVEGGYVNNPVDRGGATNRGITQDTYTEWLASKKLPYGDVKDISEDTAKRIYFERYWLPTKCAVMPLRLSVVHFDACVNHGPVRGAMLLQESLGVNVDGVIGPKTMAEISRTLESKDAENDVINKYHESRMDFYRQIVWNSPEQNIFLAGWTNRVKWLREYVAGLG